LFTKFDLLDAIHLKPFRMHVSNDNHHFPSWFSSEELQVELSVKVVPEIEICLLTFILAEHLWK